MLLNLKRQEHHHRTIAPRAARASIPLLTLSVACLLAILCLVSTLPSHAQEEESYKSLRKQGEYAKALTLIQEKIDDVGEGYIPPQWTLDYAELLFAVGRVDDAIEALAFTERVSSLLTQNVRLCEYLLYRGRMDEYAEAMERAMRKAGWIARYPDDEDRVAIARLLELREELNPKEILGTQLKYLMDNSPSYAPGFIAAGELSYSKGGYDISAGYFQEAIALEPENQRALVGLAECYWKSNDPRAEGVLETLNTLNPHNDRAKAIVIERMLDMGEAEDALDVIESALAINPNHLRMLSLKAAAHFIQDDMAAMEKTQARALVFNPFCSEVYRTAGRIASRQYRFEEAATLQEKAVTLNADDHAARALYAFDLLRLGEDGNGRQELQAAFKGDPFNVQAYNMLAVLDSLQTFQTVEDGPIQIQLPEEEAQLLADDMIELLKEAFDYYQDKYDVKLETPVHVQMFDNHDEFMVRSVGLPGNEGHLGICFGRLITMDSPRARQPRTYNWHSVLWHEFVHVVTLQKTNNRMPRWLSEGISVYEETQRSAAWGQKLDMNFKPILDEEDWPTVSAMQSYFMQPKSPQHLMIGYFLAGEFVQYYVDAYSHEALVKALALIGDGMSAEEALATAAEQGLKAVDKGFGDYLDERCSDLANLPAPSNPKEEEAFDILREGQWPGGQAPFTVALKKGADAAKEEQWEEAEVALREAHGLYPEYNGADSPLRQLAAMFDYLKEDEKLTTVLVEIIESQSSPFREIEQLLAIYKKQDDWEEVQKVAALAFAIDPFNMAMERTRAEAMMSTGEKKEAIRSLARLAHLDPTRAVEYRLQRAQLPHQTGRSGEAKAETIQLLEEMPHYWEAQKLLLAIVEDNEGAAR